MAEMQSVDDLRYWLALLRAPGVGSRTFNLLLEHYSSPEEVFGEPPSSLAAIGLRPATVAWLKQPDWKLIDQDLIWLETPGHYCLRRHDRAYPLQLSEIPDPPPLLFVSGDAAVLLNPQLAMVGSRNPSPSGERLAQTFASELVRAGLAVTSGLALGIDAASHQGAVDSGGITVAVAGTGLDQVYPVRHQTLAEAIIDRGGAMVSEFPLGTSPQAGNFPRRNRIISGLSLGTLVVEAALRSGSLITARTALEQGREVFAIPGAINNPVARGCNALIKQGAKLVETVEDILDELKGLTLNGIRFAAVATDGVGRPDLDKQGKELLKNVAYAPTSVDTLIAATGNTAEAISSMLVLLELQGYVVSTPGGFYSRV